jgi:hypothetical protein
MKKQYLIGKNKFESDVFWCLLISAVITLYSNRSSSLSHSLLVAHSIGYMVGIFSGVFVIFFLWSWKKEDAQSYGARCLLKITCGFWFLVTVMAISSVLYSAIISGFNSQIILSLLPVFIITILIVKKYCGLMHKEIK